MSTSPVLIASSTTYIAQAMHTTKGRFWAWWPWPLTYDLNLRTWPRYLCPWPTCQNSGLYVCSFGQDSETDWHMDTQTMPKLLHPPLMRGVKNADTLSTPRIIGLTVIFLGCFLWTAVEAGTSVNLGRFHLYQSLPHCNTVMTSHRKTFFFDLMTLTFAVWPWPSNLT